MQAKYPTQRGNTQESIPVVLLMHMGAKKFASTQTQRKSNQALHRTCGRSS